jgi:GntR family transcriptional regulator
VYFPTRSKPLPEEMRTAPTYEDRPARIALDRDSPLPLYRQIKGHLARMAEERHGGGERFPSESELTRLFGVSRMTVRQAIQELVDHGVLRRRRGAGTFVSAPPSEAPRRQASALAKDWPSHVDGMRVEPLAFEVCPCPADVAAILSIESGRPVRFLSRLRLAGEVPVAVDDRYIPIEFTRGIDGSGGAKPILLQLWDRVDLEEGEFELEAIGAAEREARWLRVPTGSPLMRRRLRYLAADGRTVMCGVSHYRADLVRYAVRVSLSDRRREAVDPLGFSSEMPGEARLRREFGPRDR